jgi:hypothetical protein
MKCYLLSLRTIAIASQFVLLANLAKSENLPQLNSEVTNPNNTDNSRVETREIDGAIESEGEVQSDEVSLINDAILEGTNEGENPPIEPKKRRFRWVIPSRIFNVPSMWQ